MSGPRSHRRPVGPPRPTGLLRIRPRTVDEVSAGGLVLRSISADPEVPLIARHDRRGRLIWSFPKGHLEYGETGEDAAIREVCEETGIIAEILDRLGEVDFWFMAGDRRIHKTVHHFLMRSVGGELSAEDDEVEMVEWFRFSSLADQLSYPDERRLLPRAGQLLLELVR